MCIRDRCEWVWHDGSPLDPVQRKVGAPLPPLLFDWEPPAGVVQFYKVKPLKSAFAKSFASAGSPGEIYAEELERMRAALRWPEGTPPDARFCVGGYHKFLPAFFHTLTELARAPRAFSVVLRTFGSDLPDVAEAISAFAEGEHPLWKGQRLPSLRLTPHKLWKLSLIHI